MERLDAWHRVGRLAQIGRRLFRRSVVLGEAAALPGAELHAASTTASANKPARTAQRSVGAPVARPSVSVDDNLLPQHGAHAARQRFGRLTIAEIPEQHV